jgi:MFS family permease
LDPFDPFTFAEWEGSSERTFCVLLPKIQQQNPVRRERLTIVCQDEQWPLWRKLAILTTMSLFSFSANIASACVAPTLQIMEAQLPILWNLHGPPPAFSTLTHLIAVNVLMIGLSNIFWVPLSNTFGRRPILLLSMLLSVLCSMWCGLAKGFDSLLAARVLQGVGFGPADTIAPDVVGEVFFVHQRGRALVSPPVYFLYFFPMSFFTHDDDFNGKTWQ